MTFLSSIESKLAQLRERLEGSSNVDSLCLPSFRIFLAFTLLFLGPPDYAWISSAPEGFFSPPLLSLANFASGFPPSFVFTSAEWISTGCLICILLGIKTRWAASLYVGATIFATSFLYSFGKIDHLFLVHLSVLILSQTRWSTRLALVPDRPVSESRSRTALSLLAITIAFGMFTAGLSKAVHWVDFDLSQSGIFSWWQSGFYSVGRTELLASSILLFPAWLLECLDYLVVVFELSPFLCLLLGAPYWRTWLWVAGCFHLGNTLLLNIPFTGMALVYGTFIMPYFTRKIELGLQTWDGDKRLKFLGCFTVLALLVIVTLTPPPQLLITSAILWTFYIVAASTFLVSSNLKTSASPQT